MSKRTIKIAVVGSGLAGLTASYRLATAEILNEDDVVVEVHLFEKSEKVGMDAQSIDVLLPIGSAAPAGQLEKPRRIDVPMRAFIGGYYSQLIKLYKHIGVQFHQVDYTHSLSTISITEGRPRISTSIIYNGNTGLSGIGMPAKNRDRPLLSPSFLVARIKFLLSTLLLLLCYIRLVVLCLPIFHSHGMTFGAWIERNTPRNPLLKLLGFDKSWGRLCFGILLPIFSAICTASRDEILSYPVVEILECIWAGFLEKRYVATNHVEDVVERLSQPIQHIHTSCPVTSVCPDIEDPTKATLIVDSGRQRFAGFSHIVFACEATAVPPILSTFLESLPPKSKQKRHVQKAIECTKTFQYKTTVVVNHTDGAFLPNNPGDHRDLNLVDSVPGEHWSLNKTKLCRDHTSTMVTQIIRYPMSRPGSHQVVYQTTSPMFPPRPESILSISYLERAVPTTDSKRALEGLSIEERKWWKSYSKRKTILGALQGCGRSSDESMPGIWFCGSYASSGIPLLEGCVASAKDVVDQGILASEDILYTAFEW